VSACCGPAYDRFFGARQARRDAKRYRAHGLDETAQRLVDELTRRGVDGASVLEVGGGVGAVDLELLGLGAEQAVVIELSNGYDDEARALAEEAGAEARIERRHGDFAEEEASIEPADVVVMHRVVCCYPNPELLVGAGARHARRLLALSFPRNTWWLRLGISAANTWFRLRGGIQSYVHPPAQVVGIAEAAGFSTVLDERSTRIWRIAVFKRS
jgi:magnesium-protoporphyrin O-methyltransferase